MNESTKQTEVRLNDLARRTARSGQETYSRFLEPSEFEAARRAARDQGVELELFGGYADAERRVAGFAAMGAPDQFPVRCLCARWNAKYASCGHRDLLGALMALGLVREAFGDIVVDEDRAYIFVLDEVAPFVERNLDSAGRAKLRMSEVSVADVKLPEPKGRAMRVTVPSERLDCVISAGYDLSRADAKRRIQAGDVKRNHIVEMRSDAAVAAGDVLSVRGYGRLKLISIDGETRKGRVAMQVFIYGR